MKKGKFLTALLACSMSVVAATACAFTVGCNKDNGNDDGGDNTGHVHQWATTWSHDDTNHWHACTAEGHTGAHKDVAPHVYDDDQDTTCNTCDYVRTVNGGGQEPDPGPGPATKETVTVDMKGIYDASTATPTEKNEKTIDNGTALGTNSGLKVVGTPYADPNNKTITYKGESVSLTHRLKLSSKVTNAQTGMGIEVNVEQNATVIAYYYSGSSNNTRGLELYDAEKTLIANTTSALSDGNIMATAMFNVSANTTYYIGASVAGVNVYYLAVVYGDVGETWTPHEAKAPECGVAGNIAYSESNYGRYKNGSDAYIMANAYTIAALTHNYSLKAGSITAPTETAEGAATLTCANGHETPVELPVLSSDKYTSRPEAGVTGNYVITVNGVQITFEAVGVGQKETTYTDVYKLDANAIAVLDNEVTSKAEGQNCVYRKCYTSGSNSYSGSMDPTNAKGLYVGDANTRTDVRIALGTPISAGIVKISGTIEAGTVNSKWRFFQLHGSETPDAEAFSFGLNENKKLQCWNGSAYVGTEASAEYSANTAINFEILIDLTAKKVTVKFNNVVVAEDQTYGANDLSEIGLSVNNKRSVILHNVTIATQD